MDAASIVVLGAPSAGKTVYLSALYYHLWQGHDSMTMRASSGAMHADLLKSTEAMLAGNLPPATQSLRHYEFELEYFGRTFYLRFLDYPGELFQKVFFEMAIDSDEARELYDTCTKADGVILLIDPTAVVEGVYDLDFGISNLFRFYASNEKTPEFVFAFTKRDTNLKLMDSGINLFVRQHLPHVSRLLGSGMRMLHFSSIIRSKHSVQLSSPDVVKSPLTAILEALQKSRVDAERETFLRRSAWRNAVAIGGWVVVVVICILGMFMIGVFLRQLFDGAD